MSRTTADYVGLITPFHSTRPKFVATVTASVAPFADLQALLATMLDEVFDLDAAIGVQLDAVGIRVGRSRLLSYPLQGLFFSFDDPARGFDKGQWKGPYSPGVGISSLDDDTYRRLLRSKILANRWDGTPAGAQAIIDVYFTDPETLIFVEDDGWNISNAFFTFDDPSRGFDKGAWALPGDILNQYPLDMSMTIGVAGKLPSILDLGLLGQGDFPIKPAGVMLNLAVTSINGAALFGFDVENQFICGFDLGAFGVTPEYIADNVIPQTTNYYPPSFGGTFDLAETGNFYNV